VRPSANRAASCLDTLAYAARGEHAALEAERPGLEARGQAARERGQERLGPRGLLQHHDGRRAPARAEPRLHRGHAGQLAVEEDGVERRVGRVRLLHEVERLRARGGQPYVRARAAEHQREERPDLRGVVGEQDARGPHGGHLGYPVANL
jgi:hypothetical protein